MALLIKSFKKLDTLSQSGFRYSGLMEAIIENDNLRSFGGYWTFDGCSRLETVKIQNCPKLIDIGSGSAFSNCAELKNVLIDNCQNLPIIRGINRCDSLISVEIKNCEKLIKIDDNCFENDGSLKTLIISNVPIENLGNNAFKNSGLEKIDFSNNETLKVIGSLCFYDCKKLKIVNFDNCGNLENVNNDAFSNCQVLQSASFKDCIKIQCISSSLFQNSKELISVDFSNCPMISYIGNNAFNQCEKLQDAKVLPSDTGSHLYSYIGQWAFRLCKSLAMNIDFSNCSQLTSIKGGAFTDSGILKFSAENCSNLNSLESEVFNRCKDLSEINFKGCSNITSIPSSFCNNCSNLSNAYFNDSTSMTQVDNYAFYQCVKLDISNIPLNTPSLIKIGANVFTDNNEIITIDWPNCTSLTSIDGGTFQGCKNLITFKIPNAKITSIAGFGNNMKLETVDIGFDDSEVNLGQWVWFNLTQQSYGRAPGSYIDYKFRCHSVLGYNYSLAGSAHNSIIHFPASLKDDYLAAASLATSVSTAPDIMFWCCPDGSSNDGTWSVKHWYQVSDTTLPTIVFDL